MSDRPSDRVHGGADAQGQPRWDFSTCANAAGPCPSALAALRSADLARYPDPASTAVRQALAALHGVAPWRVLPAASASEFIQRFTAVSGRLWPGPVSVPRLAYGDYAAAAKAWGRPVLMADAPNAPSQATLRWIAEPSSPLGQDAPVPPDVATRPTVLDAVYAPLRLSGTPTWSPATQDQVFVLMSPNKALGLTGVRGAYALAPSHAHYDVPALCQALADAAPSWPLSAQGDALLRHWATPAAQAWVAQSLPPLAAWAADLRQALQARGAVAQPSVTPFFVLKAPPRWSARSQAVLQHLRAHGVALRDAASFGLPGHWRVCAQPPQAQQALLQALDGLQSTFD